MSDPVEVQGHWCYLALPDSQGTPPRSVVCAMGIAGHHKVCARFPIAQKNRVCDRANASRVARQRLPVHRTHPGSTVACGGQSRLTADQKELWQAVEAGLPAKLEGSVGD